MTSRPPMKTAQLDDIDVRQLDAHTGVGMPTSTFQIVNIVILATRVLGISQLNWVRCRARQAVALSAILNLSVYSM